MCAFANAVRFNTTVSASDARLAGIMYAQKLAQSRLERSQQRSKWYSLTEDERSELLFPAPRKIHTDYATATVEQQICVSRMATAKPQRAVRLPSRVLTGLCSSSRLWQAETHFKGGGVHFRPEPLGREIPVAQVQALDPNNPVHLRELRPAHRPWHAGGGGFEGVGGPGPGTRSGNDVADKIGSQPSRYNGWRK